MLWKHQGVSEFWNLNSYLFCAVFPERGIMESFHVEIISPALTLCLKETSAVSSDFRGLIQTMWLVLRASSWDVKGHLWTIHLLWHLAFCVLSCVLTLLWVCKINLSQWSWDTGTIYSVIQCYTLVIYPISCTMLQRPTHWQLWRFS